METKKKLFNFSVSDFTKLVKTATFVDKTLMIRDVFNTSTHILIAAPQCFGKSTNINMIKRFLEIEVDSCGIPKPVQTTKNYKLFKNNNLNICNDETFFNKHFGKHPVMYIDFESLGEVCDFVNMLDTFRVIIRKSFNDHSYILDYDTSYTIDKAYFNECLIESLGEKELVRSFEYLSTILYRYFEKKVFVLVDNYDAFVNSVLLKNNNQDTNKMISFIRRMIDNLIKGNPCVGRVLLTSVLPVIGDGFPLHGSNVDCYFFLGNHPFCKYYGLTSHELNKILSALIKCDKERNKIKRTIDEIYKGYYVAGNQNVLIYSTWSILQYLHKQQVQSYWCNHVCIKGFKPFFKNVQILDKLKQLLSGNELQLDISQPLSFTDFLQLRNQPACEKLQHTSSVVDTVFILFYYFGYLTISKVLDWGSIKVKIPNSEIVHYLLKFLSGNQRKLDCVSVASVRNSDQEKQLISVSKWDPAKKNIFSTESVQAEQNISATDSVQVEEYISGTAIEGDATEGEQNIYATDSVKADENISDTDSIQGEQNISATGSVKAEVNNSVTDSVQGEEDIYASDSLHGEQSISATDSVKAEENISATESVQGEQNISATGSVKAEVNNSVTDSVQGEEDIYSSDYLHGEQSISATDSVKPEENIFATESVQDEQNISVILEENISVTDSVLLEENISVTDSVQGEENIYAPDSLQGEQSISATDSVKAEVNIFVTGSVKAEENISVTDSFLLNSVIEKLIKHIEKKTKLLRMIGNYNDRKVGKKTVQEYSVRSVLEYLHTRKVENKYRYIENLKLFFKNWQIRRKVEELLTGYELAVDTSQVLSVNDFLQLNDIITRGTIESASPSTVNTFFVLLHYFGYLSSKEVSDTRFIYMEIVNEETKHELAKTVLNANEKIYSKCRQHADHIMSAIDLIRPENINEREVFETFLNVVYEWWINHEANHDFLTCLRMTVITRPVIRKYGQTVIRSLGPCGPVILLVKNEHQVAVCITAERDTSIHNTVLCATSAHKRVTDHKYKEQIFGELNDVCSKVVFAIGYGYYKLGHRVAMAYSYCLENNNRLRRYKSITCPNRLPMGSVTHI